MFDRYINSEVMGIFIQIVILIIVLACMVMVLLGIRQLTHFEGFEDSEETRHLKKEVEERDEVMSGNSIFSNLVEMEPEREVTKKDYKSNSKEPLSRRE